MEMFFMFIAFILSIFALITSSKTASQLNLRIGQLEREIKNLHEALKKIPKIQRQESKSTEEKPQVNDILEKGTQHTAEENVINAEINAENQETAEKTKSNILETFSHIIDEEPSSKQSSEHIKTTRKRTSVELESLIGGKYLNRIGAIAMIIAVGFFLKFAFENNWINEWTRVSMGAAFGVSVIVLAGHFHKKGFSIFSQGLVAIGVSSLYLSVFAAYNFYQLIAQIPAFALMVVITVIAFLQALKYDSLAAALLALTGGFITPFLLPTDHPNEIGLFTYIALLDVGILVLIIAKERWKILEYFARFLTYLIYLLWYTHHYNRDTGFLITLFHLSLFWMIFYGFEVYKISEQKRNFKDMDVVGSGFNLISFYSGLFALLNNRYYSDHKGWATLLVGIVYFGTYLYFNKRGKVNETQRKQYVFISIGMLILATSIEYSDYTAAALFSIEAIALFWCSIRWKYSFVRNLSLVVFVFAGIQLLTSYASMLTIDLNKFQVILNERAIAVWIFILALCGGVLLTKNIEDEKNPHILKSLFIYSWIAVLFCWLTLETGEYFQRFISYNGDYEIRVWPKFIRELSFGFVWGGYGVLLLTGGLIRKNREVITASAIITVIALLSVILHSAYFPPISDHVLLLNPRTGLIVYLIVIMALQQKMYNRSDEFLKKISFFEYFRKLLAISILLLIFELVTVETYSYFEKQIVILTAQNIKQHFSDYSLLHHEIENKQQLMLSVVWLVYSIIMMIIGFVRKIRGLRFASIALSGFVVLKVFLFDLSYLTLLYRIISFFGLGVILLLTSYFYQRYKHNIVGGEEIESADN
ncbi:MAG: DUF2339 domain-containing protein [Ignavibacteriae bacterium]|nr:DUF2339 domain-containing protein [Ignavibacteriota bacterium]